MSAIRPLPLGTGRLGDGDLLARRGAGAGRRAQSPGTPASPPMSPMSPMSPQTPHEKYPLRPLAHCAPPAAVPAEAEKHTPGRMEWAAMDAFEFGEPASPTCQMRISQCAPKLGTAMRAPKDPRDQVTEHVMPRFIALVTQLTRLTGDADASRRGDLLPHLSVSDVVRQVVKRVNWFSDTGAAKTGTFKHGAWPKFCELMSTIFGGRLGRDVRQNALTDVLGCVFDVELMPDVVPVPAPEVTAVRDSIYAHSCPTACISALLSMMRHQHTESAHLNDENSVGMVVQGIERLCRRVSDFRDGDPTAVIREIQKFCEYPDQNGVDLWTRLEKSGFSAADPPRGARPSPLGCVRCLAHSIQDVYGPASTSTPLALGDPRVAGLFQSGYDRKHCDAIRRTPPAPRAEQRHSLAAAPLPVQCGPAAQPKAIQRPLQNSAASQPAPSCTAAAAPSLWRPLPSPQTRFPPRHTPRVSEPPRLTHATPAYSHAAPPVARRPLSPAGITAGAPIRPIASPIASPTHAPEYICSPLHNDWDKRPAQQRMEWYDKQASVQRRLPVAPPPRPLPQQQWLSQSA
eukprot:TRINITY_DN28574_c0_g1_i1.p1 TRINITY_DN28574_c0_g1~~TRINITY_DN28574_c0_g1_i1.p1  ORF type:complete len:595 (+),score=206.97 TRINITY_DN28574_c0_g1_i1:75-1787(+)